MPGLLPAVAPRRSFDDHLLIDLGLPRAALLDLADALTKVFVNRGSPRKKGWVTAQIRNEGLTVGAHLLAYHGWRFIEYKTNFAVLQHNETNTEFVIYRGDKSVGSGRPGFRSRRQRKCSGQTAYDAAQSEFDLVIDDEDDKIQPSRPGVRYIIGLFYIEEDGVGGVERRFQLAVNPRHNDVRILTAECLIDIDLDEWDVDKSILDGPLNGPRDGGTAAQMDILGGVVSGQGGSS